VGLSRVADLDQERLVTAYLDALIRALEPDAKRPPATGRDADGQSKD
jgi:hypothetical protein